jgi:hypothetical protein
MDQNEIDPATRESVAALCSIGLVGQRKLVSAASLPPWRASPCRAAALAVAHVTHNTVHTEDASREVEVYTGMAKIVNFRGAEPGPEGIIEVRHLTKRLGRETSQDKLNLAPSGTAPPTGCPGWLSTVVPTCDYGSSSTASVFNAECIETIATGGACGITDIYLPALRILHDDRAGTYDAVFRHRAIVGNTAANTQETAVADLASAGQCDTRGEIAVISDHCVVPDVRAACDHYIVADANPVM